MNNNKSVIYLQLQPNKIKSDSSRIQTYNHDDYNQSKLTHELSSTLL
jgi:hypothetical protein